MTKTVTQTHSLLIVCYLFLPLCISLFARFGNAQAEKGQFLMVPGILADHVNGPKPTEEVVESILKDTSFLGILNTNQLFIRRVKITINEEQMRAVQDALMKGSHYQILKSVQKEDGSIHVINKTTSNPYEIASSFLRDPNSPYSYKRIHPPKLVEILGYDEVITVPDSLSVDGNLEILKQTFPQVFNIFDQLIRFIIFEEFFHKFEMEFRRQFGLYFNQAINRWLEDHDVPVIHDELSSGLKLWIEKNGILNPTQTKINNLIESKTNLPIEIIYPGIHELSFFLESQNYFAIWYASSDFMEHVTGNYPMARKAKSPLMTEVFKKSLSQESQVFECNRFLQKSI